MLFTGKTRLLLLLLGKEGAEKEFIYPGEDVQLDFFCAAGTADHYNQEQNAEPDSIRRL
jgi:hypothetical protein